MLAVFIDSCGANALDFSAGKGGLEDVRGIDGPFCGAGADDCVQLIDEEEDISIFLDLIHHRFDALFELSAVFCAGDHES